MLPLSFVKISKIALSTSLELFETSHRSRKETTERIRRSNKAEQARVFKKRKSSSQERREASYHLLKERKVQGKNVQYLREFAVIGTAHGGSLP